MASRTSLPWRSARPAPAQTGGPSTVPCKFYGEGRCHKGAKCAFLHDDKKATTATAAAPIHAAFVPGGGDTRAAVPCRFFLSGACAKGAQCPFAHNVVAAEEEEKTKRSGGDEANEKEAAAELDGDDNSGPAREEEKESWRRELSGAVVDFGDGAAVAKVSFASDFSAVRLRGLPADATPRSVVALLAAHGLSAPALSEACVRVMPPPSAGGDGGDDDDAADDDPGRCLIADVRVEDAQFAARLCAVPAMREAFSAVAVSSSVAAPSSSSSSSKAASTSVRRVDSKKVHVSWHKETRAAWLNFGSGDIAKAVAARFQKGIYTVGGQRVEAESSFSSGAGRRSSSYYLAGYRNPVPWTVALGDVPASAAEADITQQIPAGQRPRHVELGRLARGGGDTFDPAVASASVHSLLLQAGPLEWWEESTGALAAGRRHKAKARFLHEEDAARAVDLLNGQPLPFNRLDRLTVQLVHAARLKVAAGVYDAARGAILGQYARGWKAQHVQYTPYPAAQGFRVLKLEGAARQDVAAAKAALEAVLAGETAAVRESGGKMMPLWSPAFASSSSSEGRGVRLELKKLEAEHGVAVLVDRRRSQLRVVGAPERQREAQAALAALVRTLPSASAATAAAAGEKERAILLDGEQLAWAARGGYQVIVETVGADRARLDVASTPKRILVSGDLEYQTVLNFLRLGGRGSREADAPDDDRSSSSASAAAATCAVCWTEAESAVQTPCRHVYCGGCFEELCHAGADAAAGIRCVGEAATCGAPLPLAALQVHLPSAALEDVLEAAFAAHVARHRDELRPCPTADCGQVYRAAAATTAASATAAAALFTCPACLAPVCRRCHAAHEGLSCAEHRDRASGGYAALQVAKRDLGIKDCPKCGTLIEKTDGCNHMTCTACGVHICWVCLKTFAGGQLVYSHLNEKHGGIMDVPM